MKKFFKLFTGIILCATIIVSSALVNAKTAEAATIKLSKTKLTLDVGKTYTLKLTGTTKTVKWSSSNTKVATVSKAGKVTAKKSGSAVITATASSKKYTCKVTVKAKSTAKLSKNWTDGEVMIDGELYQVLFDYQQLKDNGWDFDLADYGLDSTYSLGQNVKTYGTIVLENSNTDTKITVGLINTDKKEKAIKKCKVWSIEVSNTSAKSPVSFAIAGGIKSGSTYADIKKAFGKPSEDPYRAEDMGYTVYKYQTDDYSQYLRLVVDDKKGLTEVGYQTY